MRSGCRSLDCQCHTQEAVLGVAKDGNVTSRPRPRRPVSEKRARGCRCREGQREGQRAGEREGGEEGGGGRESARGRERHRERGIQRERGTETEGGGGAGEGVER